LKKYIIFYLTMKFIYLVFFQICPCFSFCRNDKYLSRIFYVLFFSVGSSLWIFFLFLFIVLIFPVRVVNWVRFYVPRSFVVIFPLILIIYMSNRQQIRVWFQLSWKLFFFMTLCSWPIKKKEDVCLVLLCIVKMYFY